MKKLKKYTVIITMIATSIIGHEAFSSSSSSGALVELPSDMHGFSLPVTGTTVTLDPPRTVNYPYKAILQELANTQMLIRGECAITGMDRQRVLSDMGLSSLRDTCVYYYQCSQASKADSSSNEFFRDYKTLVRTKGKPTGEVGQLFYGAIPELTSSGPTTAECEAVLHVLPCDITSDGRCIVSKIYRIPTVLTLNKSRKIVRSRISSPHATRAAPSQSRWRSSLARMFRRI